MKSYGIINHKNKEITILPQYSLLFGEDFNSQFLLKNIRGNYVVPLNKLQLNKVPYKTILSVDGAIFHDIDELTDKIYQSRSYVKSENDAKQYILNLILKGIMTNSKVYGKEIKVKFEFVDASNYAINI